MPFIDGEKIDHEEMTARLIRETELAEIIEDEYGELGIAPETVIAVATSPVRARQDAAGTEQSWHEFLNDILAGELGTDRMDYMLRDALHSGQPSGMFDYLKLIHSTRIVAPPEETEDRFRLGLDEGGWITGEQMVTSRYLMYVSLYFHKTKRIYEKHLERYLEAWLETGGNDRREPFFPTHDLRSYASLTDSRIMGDILAHAQGKDERMRRLARPFLDRSHFRLAREVLLADNQMVAKGGRRSWDEKRFDLLKEAVRLKFGTESVVVDGVKHAAVKFVQASNKIWVNVGGTTRYLDDLSEIVRGMPYRIWRGRVYAEASVRDKVTAFCNEWLQENAHDGGRKDGGRADDDRYRRD